MMKYALAFLLLFFQGITTFPQDQSTAIHILFVGNSLTYTNNLPVLVERVAETHGVNFTTELLAYPNYALEDHWNDGELQKLIASEKFQYVVVQQGPSSQADGRAMLLDYGTRIKTLCDKHRVQLVFFMVWPARVNIRMFDGVINNYTEAATKTGALLCPVGKMWKAHFEKTNDYSYYGPDGFHPSLSGSSAAAQVIFDMLKRRP